MQSVEYKHHQFSISLSLADPLDFSPWTAQLGPGLLVLVRVHRWRGDFARSESSSFASAGWQRHEK